MQNQNLSQAVVPHCPVAEASWSCNYLVQYTENRVAEPLQHCQKSIFWRLESLLLQGRLLHCPWQGML